MHFRRKNPEMMPNGFRDYRPDPIDYPYNLQAWAYPALGIYVDLWDRSLNQVFELPPTTEYSADPAVNPALLAGRPDLLVLGGGRGVFRTMPPGSRPVAAGAQIARFPTDQGVLLLAHVMTRGEPTDSLSGAWAVIAADGRVVSRGSHPMSASACDPATIKVADFSAIVPPGEYRVDLTVGGSGGRRGLVRLRPTITAPAPGLDLSDLVMLCGSADPSASGEGVVR